jgi:outer membrane lipoprotein-sorting protein
MHRFLIFGLLVSAAASGQTADEIIAKNIQARGGENALRAFETVRFTGKLTMGGFRAGYVEEVKRGNKVREETIIQGMAQIQAYDGKTAWQVSPFEGRKDPDLLSEDDRKSLVEDADMDGQLVNYKNKDHRAEFLGHDSVEGTDCYKIRLTLSNGDARVYYIDADSFLELKVETERNIRGTVRYEETLYGDYEKVNGVYFPMAIEMGAKGDSQHAKLTIEKVETNVPLSDAIFAIPATGAK